MEVRTPDFSYCDLPTTWIVGRGPRHGHLWRVRRQYQSCCHARIHDQCRQAVWLLSVDRTFCTLAGLPSWRGAT